MIQSKKGLWLLFLLCLSWSINGMDTITLMKQKTDSMQLQRAQIKKKIDPWFGKDKIDHFLTSAFLVGFAYHSSRDRFQHQPALNFAVGFSVGIGIGKEIWDKTSRKGTPSYRDLLADLAGVGLGFLIYLQAK